MKGHVFLKKLKEASQTAEEFKSKNTVEKKSPFIFKQEPLLLNLFLLPIKN